MLRVGASSQRIPRNRRSIEVDFEESIHARLRPGYRAGIDAHDPVASHAKRFGQVSGPAADVDHDIEMEQRVRAGELEQPAA